MLPLSTIWLVFVFLLGLCIGSFLNVLIYRLPRDLALSGRSFCPKCKKKISWYDNIPLLSFILLRSLCRHCHSPISVRYPLVELLTGVFFVMAVLFLSEPNIKYQILNIKYFLDLSFYFFLISAFIVIFFIDLEHQIIPDQVVYPAIVIAFLYQITNSQFPILNYFLTALGAGLFFLLIHLVTRGKGMGFGDVKLAFLIGLLLGFAKSILSFYFAFLTGAFVGVILILAGKRKFGQHIPFGPFLVFGAILSLMFGEEILQWITARFL